MLTNEAHCLAGPISEMGVNEATECFPLVDNLRCKCGLVFIWPWCLIGCVLEKEEGEGGKREGEGGEEGGREMGEGEMGEGNRMTHTCTVNINISPACVGTVIETDTTILRLLPLRHGEGYHNYKDVYGTICAYRIAQHRLS